MKISEENKVMARTIIRYNYIKYRGDAAKIKEAVLSKEHIDASELQRVTDDYMDEHGERKYLYYFDNEFDGLMKLSKPRLIIEYFLSNNTGVISGDTVANAEIVNKVFNEIASGAKAAINYVGVEHGYNEFCKKFQEKGIKCVRYQADEDILVVPLTDKLDMNIICHGAKDSYEIMAGICHKILVINGNSDLVGAISEYKERNTDKKEVVKLFAVPGKSGCYCNGLIKNGAHLMDHYKDLLD